MPASSQSEFRCFETQKISTTRLRNAKSLESRTVVDCITIGNAFQVFYALIRIFITVWTRWGSTLWKTWRVQRKN